MSGVVDKQVNNNFGYADIAYVGQYGLAGVNMTWEVKSYRSIDRAYKEAFWYAQQWTANGGDWRGPQSRPGDDFHFVKRIPTGDYAGTWYWTHGNGVIAYGTWEQYVEDMSNQGRAVPDAASQQNPAKEPSERSAPERPPPNIGLPVPQLFCPVWINSCN